MIGAVLAEARRQALALDAIPRGILWHEACVRLFIAATEILQGVADAEFAAAGHDALSPSQVMLMEAARAVAGAVNISWISGFASQETPDLSAWEMLERESLLQRVTIRRCEGYAFYALYPEQYLAAARDLPPGTSVIGLRSIGTGLAALVSVACDSELVCTLRPIGDVYARTVAVRTDLEELISSRRRGVFAIVDEGPGRSGSSLGGVADYLEALGVPPDQIIFLPGHAGDLGPDAQAAHRHRWNKAKRLHIDFETLFLNDASRSLPTWFEDVTGDAIAPLRDLSGGRWRGVAARPAAPADPAREARKYLLTTASGTYLLKFVGLDSPTSGKFARATQLHAAGFSCAPVALRHGFLAEQWVVDARAPKDSEIWPRIAPYLAFRAATFPVNTAGAPLAELVSAARYNISQAMGNVADVLFDIWPDDRVVALQECVLPVYIDGRMHRWEWVGSASSVFKVDAIDHAQAHDLVGCQDIAWDVAGAVVEFEASDAERELLVRSVLGGRAGAADLTALLTLCYLGFQIGWWGYCSEVESAECQRRFYVKQLLALLLRKIP